MKGCYGATKVDIVSFWAVSGSFARTMHLFDIIACCCSTGHNMYFEMNDRAGTGQGEEKVFVLRSDEE